MTSAYPQKHCSEEHLTINLEGNYFTNLKKKKNLHFFSIHFNLYFCCINVKNTFQCLIACQSGFVLKCPAENHCTKTFLVVFTVSETQDYNTVTCNNLN